MQNDARSGISTVIHTHWNIKAKLCIQTHLLQPFTTRPPDTSQLRAIQRLIVIIRPQLLWLVTLPSVTSTVCRAAAAVVLPRSPDTINLRRCAPHLAERNHRHRNMTSAIIWRSNICDLSHASSPRMTPFTFNICIFFFFLYPRNNCTGWYVSGETSLEWSSAVADVHGLWCFWEINAVKHLKHSQWCSMFHLLWKSRTNCRCLKELVFHVRAWQWTSGSFCGGITNPAAWSLSRLPASPSPRWGRTIYVVVALKLNAVILLLLWFNKHGLKAGETQAVSQISYVC